MRLPLIAPADLSSEQKPLYDEMRKGIVGHFDAFQAVREDGALMGPWNPWLHEPAIGKAIWDLALAMTANARLPDNVRQIAILVVGARYNAAYEIYAHVAIAEREGMPAERLAIRTPTATNSSDKTTAVNSIVARIPPSYPIS
jgi:4-carboxymuconolactone decarboxylase